MLSKLKRIGVGLLKDGERLFNRAVDKTLFKHVVFTGYLIASADDDFDADEKAALVALIKKDLPDFDTNDIVELISKCETKVAFDKGLGIQEILDEISKSADEPEDAKQIMAVCAYIGRADGDYDAREKAMARSICMALKLPRANYGL